MEGVYKLFDQCAEMESKILLLDFIHNLIDFIVSNNSKIHSKFTAPIYNILKI